MWRIPISGWWFDWFSPNIKRMIFSNPVFGGMGSFLGTSMFDMVFLHTPMFDILGIYEGGYDPINFPLHWLPLVENLNQSNGYVIWDSI